MATVETLTEDRGGADVTGAHDGSVVYAVSLMMVTAVAIPALNTLIKILSVRYSIIEPAGGGATHR
jgi:hypothetical protein